MQQETQKMLRLCISILWCHFFTPVQDSRPWFYFLTVIKLILFSTFDVAFDIPKQLQGLVNKTLSCLENIYFEVVAQSFSKKKVFLKILQNLEDTCAWVFFLIKLLPGSLKP